MEIELIFHADLFHIAIDTYKEIVKLQKELHELRANTSKSKRSSAHFVNMVAEKYDRIGSLALIVVIFCATSLEAYINHYASSNLSKTYFKKYLDKLDLLSKWVVIPRIITGKQLDTGSKGLQDLSWLITQRNKFVHYKSRKIEIADIKEADFVWGNDARRAIETVKLLAQELEKIDSDIDVGWTTNKYERYPFFD